MNIIMIAGKWHLFSALPFVCIKMLCTFNENCNKVTCDFYHLIFYNTKICYVFSLESPYRGDSNEYTQYTVFNIKIEKSH